MSIKYIKFNKFVLLSALVLSISVAISVSAQTTTSTPPVKVLTAIQKNIQLADTAIAQRIAKLNALIVRIGTMQKVSDTEKSALTASLQNEVSQLTSLKAKIDADTDAATLKTDTQSITKSYRIYALVLPQASIAAAADRILTIVGLMNGVQSKIQTRINQLPATDNTTSITASMTDITNKLSDASAQANAAVSETLSLLPDQGDTKIAASNLLALKDARSKIKTAMGDITAVRKDFKDVTQAIKGFENPAVSK